MNESAWIEAIVAVAASLTTEQLRELANLVAKEGINHSASRLQRTLSLSTRDSATLARTLSEILSNQSNASTGDVATALRVLAGTRALVRPSPQLVEIVCTAPDRLGVHLRATYATAREMIQSAKEEVFVAGYVFTEGASGLIGDLASVRRERGTRITIIGNRMRQHLSALRSHWPRDVPGPRVYSREANPADEMAALHAKIIVCDRCRALVTSANFSRHGLHENIEIGVHVEASSVGRLADFLDALILHHEVEPVDW